MVSGGGSLHAMMLDMKRTFDEIVEAHADPERAAQILANPFYQSLSSSFAGTQEYMAMEKLGQLRRSDEWDLIVVDTPPCRSALDFLDAPQRLGRFLDGRLIRLLMAPGQGRRAQRDQAAQRRFRHRSTGALTKMLGAQVLKDAADVRLRAGHHLRRLPRAGRRRPTGCCRRRARRSWWWPRPSATRCARRPTSWRRLDEERMPLAGLILNRVHRSAAGRLSAARSLAAAETLEMQDKPNGSGSDAPRYSSPWRLCACTRSG